MEHWNKGSYRALFLGGRLNSIVMSTSVDLHVHAASLQSKPAESMGQRSLCSNTDTGGLLPTCVSLACVVGRVLHKHEKHCIRSAGKQLRVRQAPRPRELPFSPHPRVAGPHSQPHCCLCSSGHWSRSPVSF